MAWPAILVHVYPVPSRAILDNNTCLLSFQQLIRSDARSAAGVCASVTVLAIWMARNAIVEAKSLVELDEGAFRAHF